MDTNMWISGLLVDKAAVWHNPLCNDLEFDPHEGSAWSKCLSSGSNDRKGCGSRGRERGAGRGVGVTGGKVKDTGVVAEVRALLVGWLAACHYIRCCFGWHQPEGRGLHFLLDTFASTDPYRLVGPVVKASASRATDLGSIPACAVDLFFPGRVIISTPCSDLKISTPCCKPPR